MRFDIGKQPCSTYCPNNNLFDGSANQHECFCKKPNGEYCGGYVSWCENCHKDHHGNGYETCECGKEIINSDAK